MLSNILMKKISFSTKLIYYDTVFSSSSHVGNFYYNWYGINIANEYDILEFFFSKIIY